MNEATYEEERADKIAEALTRMGLSASTQDTGGGIVCVVIERNGGGEIAWGTADVTWGAVITNQDGEQISSIETQWPSGSEDIAATAEVLLEHSTRNGAVLADS